MNLNAHAHISIHLMLNKIEHFFRFVEILQDFETFISYIMMKTHRFMITKCHTSSTMLAIYHYSRPFKLSQTSIYNLRNKGRNWPALLHSHLFIKFYNCQHLTEYWSWLLAYLLLNYTINILKHSFSDISLWNFQKLPTLCTLFY